MEQQFHPIEVWWWMALLILLFCCFFQPTWKKKPQDSQRNKTCKLTTSDLHEFLNQPNKHLRFFHWISALKPTTNVLQMDAAERGAPDFQWKKICGVATGSCNAPTWSWGAVAERKTWGNWSFMWRLRTEFNEGIKLFYWAIFVEYDSANLSHKNRRGFLPCSNSENQ